jgi:hypothetical protein
LDVTHNFCRNDVLFAPFTYAPRATDPMLINLTIANFAIIDRLEVQFDEGFNVLTGETGAGKSIFVPVQVKPLWKRFLI